jgi:hypothetical protein
MPASLPRLSVPLELRSTWKTTEHLRRLKKIAAQESPRKTKLYDRVDDPLTVDEIENFSVRKRV